MGLVGSVGQDLKYKTSWKRTVYIVYIVQIPEYERAVVFGSTLDMAFVRGPGLIFVLPFLEKVIIVIINNMISIILSRSSWSSSWWSVQIRKIDTRTSYYEIPPQQILSTDSVTLTVDAVRLLLILIMMMSTMTMVHDDDDCEEEEDNAYTCQ